MNLTIQARRQPLPSILTVYRPIEEYWESSRPVGEWSRDPSEALDPFDAFLVHRLLELVPGRPTLIDVAMSRTGGASSLIGLTHSHVRAVWAVTEPGSLASERAVSGLRDHVNARGHGPAQLEVVARSELTTSLVDEPGSMILIDARDGDAAGLAREIGRWFDERSDVWVLVLGLGRVGDCPAIAALLSLCTPGSGRRLRLLRDLSEVLVASQLGLVTRHDHPHVAEVLLRLEQSYIGNYGYLDLLRQVNEAALREANLDADLQRTHPTFGPLSAEIEELKRSAHEAREQAANARRALEEVQAQLDALPFVPRRLLGRVRRKLAPTVVGRAYRLAKRVRQQLAPTPVGRAYRLAKRGARACLPHAR